MSYDVTVLKAMSQEDLVELVRRKNRAIADIGVALEEIDEELREQASGSQDGYLLEIANRIRKLIYADMAKV